MTTLIAPGKNLGYSSIYIDFLTGTVPAKGLYLSDNYSKVLERLHHRMYDRDKLVQILKKQNTIVGSSEKTFANIEKLKSEDAVALFSGQQSVLFGGPTLIMIKALTLVKSAEDLTKKLKRPVIPIFWMAGDDHDFDEINHTLVLNRQSEEVIVSYNTRPQQELPASEIILSDKAELIRVKAQIKEVLGASEFTPKLYELIDQAYQPGETFVTAFGKLLAGLTAEYGLVLFSPGDADVKKCAVNFFKELISKQDELHKITSLTNQKILDSGYHLQVEKAENSTHLFCNLNGRKPVQRDGAKFKVGEKSFSLDDLLKLIEKEPQNFSPDVLTRPPFQSYLFPVVAQRGGPAEIAYLAQSAPIFELFGLPVPVYQNRPSVTLIEKHFEKTIREYKINFEDLTGDIEQVINKVLAKSFPEHLEKDLAKLRHNLEKQFEALKKDTLEFDPGLKEFAGQTFGKIDFALKNFEAKLFAAHKKKSQDVRNRIYRLWHAFFPNKGLQERSLNIGYFISKYGFGIIKFMYDKIDINEKSHQLISLSDFKGE